MKLNLTTVNSTPHQNIKTDTSTILEEDESTNWGSLKDFLHMPKIKGNSNQTLQ
jgi:hypothetical protein